MTTRLSETLCGALLFATMCLPVVIWLCWAGAA